MKKSFLILTAAALMASQVISQETDKPEKGKDKIVVPAVGEGLSLHNLFQSNMIIQRDKPISVWGWADPGEKITVFFSGNTTETEAAKDRTWKVTLPALPANSEPQTLTIKGKDKTLTLENILIGDVWLLGGQSNMEFEIAKLEGGALEIASANFDKIRLLTIPQQNGPEPKKGFPRGYEWSGWFGRHFRRGDWEVCSPETVREMSGIGYIFGRRLHMATQVPIGLIDVSRGGTCVETWIPLEVLRQIDTPEVKAKLAEWDQKIADFDPQEDLDNRIKKHHEWVEKMKSQGKEIPADRKEPDDLRPGPAVDMNRPGNCYASMMAPIAGVAIKGAIWHQGFNNAMQGNGHVMYYQVFSKMIEEWRKTFSDPEMPFGIISLCTAGDPQDLDDYVAKMSDEGIYIREVQYKTFVDLKNAGDENIGFASSFDQRRAWYHPQIKIPVGERIAQWALATQYGMDRQIKWEPPTYSEMVVEDGSVMLKLKDQMGPYNDGPILGFAIAGNDGRFQPAKAEYLLTGKDSRGRDQFDRKVLVLSSPLVPEPVHFRHAWGRNPLTNMKANGIPFATQRSDNWKLTDMYELYTGKKPEASTGLNRAEKGELDKALRAEDLKRRLYEAEALIREHKPEADE